MLVYRSPNSSEAKFVEYIEETYTNDLRNDTVIIMGDFNIDMKMKNHIQGKLTKVMHLVGLKQLVKEATRITLTSETIIDLVFSNMEMEITVCHEPKITDHSTVVMYWKVKGEENRNKKIISRDYKRMDIEEFKRLIRINLSAIEGDNINILANLTINEIVKCLDAVSPRKVVILKEKWKGKKWYSEDIYRVVKQRDSAFKTARMSKKKDDWELFRQLRNKTVDLCRKAKRGYLEEKLDKNKKNMKQMWGTLKEMLKGSSLNKDYKVIQCGNKVINNAEEMVNTLNSYFIDSVSQLKSGLEENCLENIKYTDSEFREFKKIEIKYLSSVVKKLVNKAGTEEGITVEVMKFVVEAAGEKICDMLNRSLEEGIFPNEWKEAIVVPVPKVKGTIKIEEFRPINKLPVYEKVLEIMVQRQLVEYLENNELLQECQSGFRIKHSCETALQWVISSWKKTIGDGKIIGVVFLDLKRAFEIVDREILIKKLQWYGLKGTVLSWFESYLDNRTQRVKFNGRMSASIKVESGVPQGSVLGPLLFLIYINDIIETIDNKCQIRLFADDALIYATGHSSKEINDQLNVQMAKVEEWLKINKLILNVDKTKVMVIKGIRNKTKEEKIKIYLQGGELEVVSEIKYLGVIIDKNLNFSAHVDYISKKVGAKLGVMRRIGADLTPYIRCIVYKSIVAPIFEYCSSIFVGLSKGNIQHLQKLQNVGMRIILRCNKRTRIIDMLEALHFMTINERIEYNVCMFVHKMVNGVCPKYLLNKIELVKNKSAIKTRQTDNLYIQKCRTREEQKMLLHDGFKLYNNLPREIKCEQNVQTIRRMLVEHIINKRREHVEEL